jgi:hypothetical protein
MADRSSGDCHANQKHSMDTPRFLRTIADSKYPSILLLLEPDVLDGRVGLQIANADFAAVY